VSGCQTRHRAGMERFHRVSWKVELAVLVAVTLAVSTIVMHVRGVDEQRRRAAAVRSSAVAAALAVERAASDEKGSYLTIDGADAVDLQQSGYRAVPGVRIRVRASQTEYCVTATDDRLSPQSGGRVALDASHRVREGGGC